MVTLNIGRIQLSVQYGLSEILKSLDILLTVGMGGSSKPNICVQLCMILKQLLFQLISEYPTEGILLIRPMPL